MGSDVRRGVAVAWLRIDNNLPTWESWIRQAFVGNALAIFGHTTWPYFKPPGVVAAPSSQLSPRRHSPVVPYGTPGVTERIGWYEYNDPGAFPADVATEPYGFAADSIPAPDDEAAGWLLEEVQPGGADWATLTYDTGGELYVPTPETAFVFADPQNTALHYTALATPPPDAVKQIAIDGGLVNATTDDWHFYTPSSGWGDSLPILVKPGATDTVVRRQPWQAAYIVEHRMLDPRSEDEYGFTWIWEWDGSSWSETAPREVTGTGRQQWTSDGHLMACLFGDPETGAITGGQEIADGGSRFIYSNGPENTHGIINFMRWPLGVRAFRGSYRQAYDGSVKTWTRLVVMWRPMGDWIYVSGPEYDPTGVLCPPGGGTWTRDGFDGEAGSWIQDSAIDESGYDDWQILGAIGGAGSATIGDERIGGDIPLSNPPSPGQAVWITAVEVQYDDDGSDPILLASATVLFCDATVLPYALPVFGGGAMVGGSA